MSATLKTETERNYEAFVSQLPGMIQNHQGQFALLHDQRVVGYFRSAADAVLEGFRRYGADQYSVQEVTDEVESLGFYSYAGGPLQA